MSSIFSRIIAGEIPCHKIAETAECFAFLDIRPLAKGHTLVVPKKETDYIVDVDDDTLSKMMVFAKKVGRAIEQVIPCVRIGVAVIGLEVPHAHIHLIPLNRLSDMDFKRKPLQLEADEMAQIAADITAKYEQSAE